MDGWLSGSRFYEQVGFQGNLYLPLWNAPIPYWFVCDGRRAVVIAKISTQYEVAVFGLLDPYYSPGQWPYPLVLGGSMSHGEFSYWDDTDYRWSVTDNRHRIPTHAETGSAPVGTGERDPWDTQLRVRNLDGSWKAVEGASSTRSPPRRRPTTTSSGRRGAACPSSIPAPGPPTTCGP